MDLPTTRLRLAAAYETTVVPFRAGDGRALNLHHAVGRRPPTRGPLILVHGAGVRADIFRPPVPTTIVDLLVEDGWDVWLENWRASIDVEPNRWTLDQAAVYDHPRAVRTVLEHTGADTLKALIHCQGSTSFTMSSAAGLLPEVTTIVANAVTLHPVVPPLSRIKLTRLSPLLARLTPYLNPRWGIEAHGPVARAIRFGVNLVHRECDNPVCKLVSFAYGIGFPTLWSHRNLNPATHDHWLSGEFAEVPLTFFAQMARCVARGHLVSVDGLPELPESFVAQPPQTDARFVLLAGADNRCFLAESQRRTFRYLDGLRPGKHALHVFPGYGHLDVFLGRRAASDIGPTILKELRT
ncbi:MAG: alpha/beta hydrolase [Actinomycetota bacterium]|nr:alpha/beta hydrolase [Actinomycetota bacterium]